MCDRPNTKVSFPSTDLQRLKGRLLFRFVSCHILTLNISASHWSLPSLPFLASLNSFFTLVGFLSFSVIALFSFLNDFVPLFFFYILLSSSIFFHLLFIFCFFQSVYFPFLLSLFFAFFISVLFSMPLIFTRYILFLIPYFCLFHFLSFFLRSIRVSLCLFSLLFLLLFYFHFLWFYNALNKILNSFFCQIQFSPSVYFHSFYQHCDIFH